MILLVTAFFIINRPKHDFGRERDENEPKTYLDGLINPCFLLNVTGDNPGTRENCSRSV